MVIKRYKLLLLDLLKHTWESHADYQDIKAAVEKLIRQFPHHLTATKAASALQFAPALFSYEIYQVHCQHVLALEELENNPPTAGRTAKTKGMECQ